jgi:surface antigen
MASMTGYRKAAAGGTAAGRAAILAATILGLVPSLGWAAEDPRDAAFLAPVLQRLLETARTDVEIPWNNPETGNHGNIVIERTFYRGPDTPCRAFVRTLEAAGAAPQVTRGTGCRSSTGLWLIEEEPAMARTAPREAPVPAPEPEALAEAGPTCPDTVLVPMPAVRPPAFAYTLPSRAEL